MDGWMCGFPGVSFLLSRPRNTCPVIGICEAVGAKVRSVTRHDVTGGAVGSTVLAVSFSVEFAAPVSRDRKDITPKLPYLPAGVT